MLRSLFCGVLATACTSLFAQTVQLEQVLTGLDGPVNIAQCGDARLFIVERTGRIRIFRPTTGKLDGTPFLDLSAAVNTGYSEQGLLGFAFHPQYAQNGYFYVYYCTGTGSGSVRVSRFSVSNDPNVANASSEVVLWQLAQPYENHKGGMLAFGPDGYLYFAPGDGGGSGDPENRAQNMSVGQGKMHRIDVNGGSPYAIPPTNPFANANNTDTLRTIFASGFRNPFRFSFDRATGDLWIGDVGQSTKEEIDRILAGDHSGPNFGWRCYEGSVAYNTAGCAPQSSYTQPLVDHDHAQGWCSVIGGFVYRGTNYSSLTGRYIYTDYCHGRIVSLHKQGANWIQDTLTMSGQFGLASFGEDVRGELYLLNTEYGKLYRLIDPAAVVRVNAKVFLEGPYNSVNGTMNDGLRTAAALPTTEPYTTALGYPVIALGGGESTTSAVLTTSGNNAVVDWVRVELRASGHPDMVVASAQGLLQRDGDVVAGDGVSALVFHVGPGNYHVCVKHRNHLGAMTASPVALTNAATTVDFRSTSTALYGTAAMRTIGSVRALWQGDVDGDGSIRYTGNNNDRDPILQYIGGTTPNATLIGYRMEDVNLDAITRYTGGANDRDPILVNVGGTTPNAVRIQQLP